MFFNYNINSNDKYKYIYFFGFKLILFFKLNKPQGVDNAIF